MPSLLHWTVFGCLFWPLWSAIICGFFGYLLGSRYAVIFAISCLWCSFCSAWLLFFELGFMDQLATIFLHPCIHLSGSVLNPLLSHHVESELQTPAININWGLLFDALTIIILIVINSISLLVHLYAKSYISTDLHQPRFFANLSLFTFFMVVLVTADNFFQLFVGWEGVGLCSYLLIGFWYTRFQAHMSALQALIINKIGDITLILALICLILCGHTVEFSHVFEISPFFQYYIINIGFISLQLDTFLGLMFFVGAVAKSAQLGLHTWLLSAMEGPTPVSALLHAATMVTAGIFLIMRGAPLWATSTNIIALITIWGAITTFFAATCGIVQYDIKKIIALSTCSQLGYMFYGCGLGEYTTSLFHLTNHAFFKALLFLCAGAVIHALGGEQDLRRIGGLLQLMPITYISMFIASLALMGFPYLSGFYSKDLLIELAWVNYTYSGKFAYWLATCSAFLTAFYSCRLLYYIFLTPPNGYKYIYQKVEEADSLILFVFRPLIIGSIFSGYFFFDLFVGTGSLFFSSNLYISTNYWTIVTAEDLPYYIKLIPILISLGGILSASLIYLPLKTYQIRREQFVLAFYFQFQGIHAFLVNKWGFDTFYNYFILTRIYLLGYYCYIYGDQGVLEWVGPQGFYALFLSWASVLGNKESTIPQHLEFLITYGFLMCLSFILLLVV